MKMPKLNIPIRYLSLLFVLLFVCEAKAQKTIEIAIISDSGQDDNHKFEQAIKAEISTLLSTRYNIQFPEFYTS
ncbi:MAG: hypothetical protein IPL49_07975 [Saprospirales bacterium]|nr:hypothetical protein [Saprospirales bacterium]